MDPMTIIAILKGLAEIGTSVYNSYEQSKTVLSATNAAEVHAALLQIESVTSKLRAQVDAALDEAAKN